MDDTRPVNIIKTEAPRRYTLGVVYEPGVTDAHGDQATAEEIEQAAWAYLAKLQEQPGNAVSKTAFAVLEALTTLKKGETRRLDVTALWADLDKARGALRDMHQDDDTAAPGRIVESYIAPVSFVVPGSGGLSVKQGTWLLGVQWTEQQFEKILAGERTGLSLGGKAFRLPVRLADGE